MAEWVDIPIGTKCYRPRSGTQSIERLINLYADPSKIGGKTAVTIHGTPGLLAWTTVGNGPIRGMRRAFGYVWVVSGTSLYAVNESTKNAQLVGGIAGLGPVRMIHNATHVAITTNQFAYAASLSGVTTLPDENLVGATYQDGYGIYVVRNSQDMLISGSDDLTTIDTDFTTVDALPDHNVACISHRGQVVVVKERSGEVYYLSGDSAFPFDRVGGGYFQRGCAAPGSLAAADEILFWLGDDLRVYAMQGYNPVPISTEDIDRLIAEAYGHSSAEAFVYTQGGKTFYILSFADLTLGYDVGRNDWHERKSRGIDRWRAQCHVQIGDTHLVGDYETNEIYELDLNTYAEDGEILERVMVLPPISDQPRSVITHELFIDMETGVGLASGQGVDPKIVLSSSDDDGATWGNDIEASLGVMGAKRTEVKFNRLGRSRNRSYRLTVTDPVKVAILGARARLEVLAQ